LEEELSYEKENEEPTQPAFIKEFLETNSFKVSYLGLDGETKKGIWR
jgi:complement component 1 Q subcomponent-binding protein